MSKGNRKQFLPLTGLSLCGCVMEKVLKLWTRFQPKVCLLAPISAHANANLASRVHISKVSLCVSKAGLLLDQKENII